MLIYPSAASHSVPALAPGWRVEDAPGPPPDPPRPLDRVRQAIRVRHHSRRTEEACAGWIRRFILFHRRRHAREMGQAEVTAFLSSLAVERRVSAATTCTSP